MDNYALNQYRGAPFNAVAFDYYTYAFVSPQRLAMSLQADKVW
jgi:hypothetical protein